MLPCPCTLPHKRAVQRVATSVSHSAAHNVLLSQCRALPQKTAECAAMMYSTSHDNKTCCRVRACSTASNSRTCCRAHAIYCTGQCSTAPNSRTVLPSRYTPRHRTVERVGESVPYDTAHDSRTCWRLHASASLIVACNARCWAFARKVYPRRVFRLLHFHTNSHCAHVTQLANMSIDP